MLLSRAAEDGAAFKRGCDNSHTANCLESRMRSDTGPSMTLGNAARARVRLIVWCKACQHQIEPDPAEMAERYGAEMAVPDWRERLVCSKCGSREIDMVVTGTARREEG